MDLSGKVVVVPVDWAGAPDLATAMAMRGATVVLVGGDGDRLGRLAAQLEAGGSGRPAVFLTEPGSTEALAEYLSELFRPS